MIVLTVELSDEGGSNLLVLRKLAGNLSFPAVSIMSLFIASSG